MTTLALPYFQAEPITMAHSRDSPPTHYVARAATPDFFRKIARMKIAGVVYDHV